MTSAANSSTSADPSVALEPGCTIAAVAPSGPFDAVAFDAGLAYLRERYDVRVADGVTSRAGYLAGSDERRLSELLAAIDDPEVAAICCARGGYGAARLLPSVSVASVREARKPLIGFSDITALHGLWSKAGVPSVHGPMVAALGAAPRHREGFVDVLEGSSVRFEGLEGWGGARARGPLIGGNLAVLTSLLGSPYFPTLDGAILFLEDIAEPPYRVDRMLTSLELAGHTEGLAGVALGAFTDSNPGPHGVEVRDVLRERTARWRVPVVFGLPCGHITPNASLPLGTQARLDAEAGIIEVDGV